MKKISLFLAGMLVSVSILAQSKAQFTMTMKSFKNGVPEKETHSIDYNIKDGEIAVHTPEKDKSMTIIMNPETKMMTTLMESKGRKSGSKMKMPEMMMAKEGEPERDPVKLTATNEHKEINGYKCTKYEMESTKYNGYIWMTQDVKWNYADFAKSMSKMGSRMNKNSAVVKIDEAIKGFPILMFQKEKEGKDSFEVSYSNIQIGKCNEAMFSMEGYEITDVSQFQR